MFKVGLDLRATESSFKAHAGRGTGRYVSELTKHLTALLAEDARLAKLLSVVPIYSEDFAKRGWEEALLRVLPAGRRTFESQVAFPQRISRIEVDAVHFFAHGDAPAFWSKPQFVTVLDLIPLRFPELYRGDKMNLRFKFARHLEYEAIRRAQGIVAISESTRNDVQTLLGVPAEKVIVTPLGVGDTFTNQDPAAVFELRQRLGIESDRPVVLYVGGIDPRKNVPFLLEVFARLLSRNQVKPVLVLAGRHTEDDQYPLLQATIERLQLKNDVLEAGFVADEDLPILYAAADVFAFPSLFEGFGFPVLEAMGCGTAVVANRNSSIPEVAGDAALLLADGDFDGWVLAIEAVLLDEQRRAELIDRGSRQAAKFTWAQTAARTAEAYLAFLSQTKTHDGRLFA